MTTPTTTLDPLPILKGLASLRRLTGAYPPGHPMITQKIAELQGAIGQHLSSNPSLRIDVIHGDVHVDGLSSGADAPGTLQLIRDLAAIGVESIHFSQGLRPEDLHGVAMFLWEAREGSNGEPFESELAKRGVQHVSLGRLVQLDTRWRVEQWPDRPTGPLDPAYAESLLMAEQAFDSVAAGERLNPVTVRDLVELLIYRVARSHAALGQILAVKQYENLTYCHSVNVAMLSLLIGREVGLDDQTIAALVEAALLHDIGKTRIPLEIVKKPGALDRRERRLIEAHTTLGAEILVKIDGLKPLTPTVALEHHRTFTGAGYPDLGSAVPHPMSQIVSVADIYEAMTGARTYQAPQLPERACLILARLAGDKLNSALVKAFIGAVTFFPIGSLVRTSREEVCVVVRTSMAEPLHPVVALVNESMTETLGEIDTSVRGADGSYERHIVQTLTPQSQEFDLTRLLPQAA
jgi:putative nucleotidyltransferase with HDIG domain